MIMMMLSITVLLLTLLPTTLVKGDILLKENCPPFCKDQHLSGVKSLLCVGECSPRVKQTVANDKCLEECISKNPEASELCNFNCKLQKKDVPGEDKKVADKVEKVGEPGIDEGFFPGKASSLTSSMMKMHSYMDNLLDHIMDGARHQKEFGAFANPGPFRKGYKDISSFFNHADSKKDEETLARKVNEIPLKDDGGLEVRKLGGDSIVGKDNAVEKSAEQVDMFAQPVLHRFIIIKRIPLFTIFNKAPKIGESKIEKSVSEESHSTFGSFFSARRQEKCAWKKSLMLLLCCLFFISSTWFCMARLLTYRTRCIQDSAMKAAADDFNYMIPIDEKMAFLKSDEELFDDTVPPPAYKPVPSPGTISSVIQI